MCAYEYLRDEAFISSNQEFLLLPQCSGMSEDRFERKVWVGK